MARKPKPLILQLPLPPSVNRLNINRAGRGRGRVTSTEVIAWRQVAGVRLSMQKWKKIPGPIVIVANFEKPTKNSDVDNRVKILFDFLVKKEVIDDDRNVVAFAAAWLPKPSLTEPIVQVAIYPASDLPPKIEFLASNDGSVGAWIHQTTETVT
jgi:Holliday junction resolvase RusA-like endonuclease